MDNVPEKKCVRCGKDNPTDANFCVWCGSDQFEDSPSLELEYASVPRQLYVGLTIWRVLLFTIISSGVYLLYWAYLTWAQLKKETGGDYFPVWHALSLLVPVYGLFRLYRHIQVIRSLCGKSDVATNLSPALAVTLFLLSGVLSAIAAYSPAYIVILLLSLISLALIITLLVWAQGTLNAYWIRTLGPNMRQVNLGAGEILLTMIGVLWWVPILVPQ